MKSVIVGTAGHIDHGKTALVRALTGIDTDRLEEEKRRGITIDLGFAHLDLVGHDLAGHDGEVLRLGFVDVPGHERFVRNMLAGVGGIDLVVLVIAADASIQPQTREHFDICRLLNVQRGITVLTKADLVDAETLEVTRLEVEEFLQGSFLEGAPIVSVSAKTGLGIDELKLALAAEAQKTVPRESAALARLPIDRAFSMKGFGTVVTGTLISGTVRPEDELDVYPSGRRVRVRGVQVHGAAAERAVAGQRTALNLAGAAVADLARGMMLGPVGTFRATARVDVDLTLLPSARPLKNRARVHLHTHTTETVAEVVLGEGQQVAPGGQALARLRLAEPALLLPGDRFILRQLSPVLTLGGGIVLDAAPLPRAKKDLVRAFLRELQTTPEAGLLARIARREASGLRVESAVEETGWRREAVELVLAGALSSGKIVRIGSRYVTREGLENLEKSVGEQVLSFHKKSPLVAGIGKEELKEELLERWGADAEVFAFIVQRMVGAGKLAVSGEVVHLPGRGVSLSAEEAVSKHAIESAFATAQLHAPALKEVLAGLHIDEARAKKLVTLLLRDKVLVKVSDELVFHRTALESLRAVVAARKAQSPKMDVGAFKEMTGVSRKYAIPLLEYMDRERITRRVGNERIIL